MIHISQLSSWLAKSAVLTFTSIIFATGCSKRPNNLAPTYLLIAPTVNISRSPGFTARHYTYFFVLSPSAISHKSEYSNAIIEEAMCRRLSCELEAHGYLPVPDPKDADIIATVRGSNQYGTYYVPAETFTIPKYVPGQTYNSTSSYEVYGNNSALPYATIQGNSTTTTQGQWSSENVTRSGYTAGNYYPEIRIQIIAAKSGDDLYLANATGSSNQSDIRIASQLLFMAAAEQLPFGNMTVKHDGVIGIKIQMATINGNDYYPYVYKVVKKSPATKAGIDYGDSLVEIDGTNTLNADLNSITDQLQGEAGSQVYLRMFRSGKLIDKVVERAQRAKVYPIETSP